MGLQKCALNLNRIGKELQPHGTAKFPCAGYSAVYTDRPEDVIPWHWHEELEIVFVETGGLKLQIPGKTFHLGKGRDLSSIPTSLILQQRKTSATCIPWSSILF